MAENKIELKAIRELLGMNFFIPSYQRGYRWDKQQVEDLMNDIQDFIKQNSSKEQNSFYCIQPLVVKKGVFKKDIDAFKTRLANINFQGNGDHLLTETENLISEYTKWEVIDGQQRLTTIYIILSSLDWEKKYIVEYETRTGSKDFLEKIDESKKYDNIDYYHMVVAKQQIENWFKDDNDKEKFRATLLEKVQFIWYESGEDSIKVFTRLNIGKIPLTNAELIKALFLNQSNFQSKDYKKTRLQQQEIASEWDTIEYTLQNDEFWLFLNEPEYDKPTRIDFIFDLMCEMDTLKLKELKENYETKIGTDEYKTFRYFYLWFKQDGNLQITECWTEVRRVFLIFQEWFNDLKLYHYVGYLIENRPNVLAIIIKEWQTKQTKTQFETEFLIPEIRKKINITTNDLETLRYGDNKIRHILLLHNIQTVIEQNSTLCNSEKYKLPIFYKFPFHLFKKEKWNVEHIDSKTENQLESEKEQKEWLKYSFFDIQNEELKEKISKFIAAKYEQDFDELYQEILNSYQQSDNKLSDEEKDNIWNLTLLDSSTNKSYQNAIFPAKRRYIIGKDQGIKITIDDNLKEKSEPNGTIAFIPPCTKNVFLKYYNPATNNLREWDKQDAEKYLENMQTVLKDFLMNNEEVNEGQ
jgi:uncharacterized protein with ParB-like and HNH nuclease domain